MTVTPRAYLVGAMGFCFYLILLFNTNLPSQFYALSWLSVGVLVSSLGVALLTLLGLKCEWRIANARVTEELEYGDTIGGGPTLEIELANSGSFNKIDLIFEVNLHSPRRNEVLTRRILIEALPSGSSLVSEVPLTELPRGRYRLQSLAIHGGDVLGLFRVRRRLPLRPGVDLEDLIVGPAVAMLSPQGSGSSGALQGAAQRSAHGQGHGEDFRGTRLYVPGDDLRTVHWKSTARLGQLVVKEFHHNEQIQRLVIWDGHGGFDLGFAPHTASEFSLRLTMSLCRALAERGRSCNLLRLDAHPLFLPSARGKGSTLGLMVEALADGNASRANPLDVALGSFLRHLGGGSQVTLVSPQNNGEVLRAAMLLRAQGAQVTVVLVNAAAFAVPERNTRRGEKLNADVYRDQARTLHENGFEAIVTPVTAPEIWNGATELALLRSAVHGIVEPHALLQNAG